jgi:hypothetical protein
MKRNNRLRYNLAITRPSAVLLAISQVSMMSSTVCWCSKLVIFIQYVTNNAFYLLTMVIFTPIMVPT